MKGWVLFIPEVIMTQLLLATSICQITYPISSTTNLKMSYKSLLDKYIVWSILNNCILHSTYTARIICWNSCNWIYDISMSLTFIFRCIFTAASIYIFTPFEIILAFYNGIIRFFDKNFRVFKYFIIFFYFISINFK